MSQLLYIQSLGELYEQIQQGHVFPDSKTFVDCRLQAPVNEILAAWNQEKNRPGFDLGDFVARFFTLPETPQTGYVSGDKTITEHLDALWPLLTRAGGEEGSTLIPLPHPYIVPGGRFREIYYWDSYFTQLGLKKAGKTELIRQMVDNFAWLIQEFGFIPNGNRTYYLSRSQPPFFAMMVDLLMSCFPEENIRAKYFPVLEKEYEFWMDGQEVINTPGETCRRLVVMPDGSFLNRYWDDRTEPRPEAFREDLHTAHSSEDIPAKVYRHIRAAAESGWDFSSRWFRDPQDMSTIQTALLIPVDLNCLLYGMEVQLTLAAVDAHDEARARHYAQCAKSRAAAIQRWCWDEQEGFFKDYHFTQYAPGASLHLGAVFPLCFRLATPEQAALVAEKLEKQFLHYGGLVTTLENTGQQWDAPNGWAPLQWMAYSGLKNYGFDALAETIRERWVALNQKVYQETGKMMEKYNVMDADVRAGGGEYPNQDGFGWTNGVFSIFFEK